MAIYESGVEGYSQNPQVLDDPLFKSKQGSPGDFLLCTGTNDQATPIDPRWLKDNLQAARPMLAFSSPVKTIAAKLSIDNPESPLEACWSPQALNNGHPMKTMRAASDC